MGDAGLRRDVRPARRLVLRERRLHAVRYGGNVAAPGEANRITVRGGGGSDVIVRDDGAQVTAGAGCRLLDQATAACPRNSVMVRAGDGDDEILAETGVPPTAVSLGPGDDRSTGVSRAGGDEGSDVLQAGDDPVSLGGGPGDDVLVGSPADDTLSSGPGADILRGEGGDDVVNVSDIALDALGSPIANQTFGDDRTDGGPGRDELSYFYRSTGVVVRLADGEPEGGPHERDMVTGFEDVEGGNGDDLIVGDAGPNRIDSGFGSDRLAGLGGDDELRGGPGVNDHTVLRGGDGDDVLRASGAARLFDGGPGDDVLSEPLDPAVLRCGPGNDLLGVGNTTGRLLLVDGCERLAFGDPEGYVLSLAPPEPSQGRRAAFRLSCPAERFEASCRTAVVVTDARGRRLGATRRVIAPGRSGALVVRYERAPPASGTLRVRVEVARMRNGPPGRPRVRLAFVLQRAGV